MKFSMVTLHQQSSAVKTNNLSCHSVFLPPVRLTAFALILVPSSLCWYLCVRFGMNYAISK